MDKTYTRRLLNAMYALIDTSVNDAESLFVFLPSEYRDFYRGKESVLFSDDSWYMFTACIEDYFDQNEDKIAQEIPNYDELVLINDVYEIFEPCEPLLHINDPAAWKKCKEDLKAFCQRLEVLIAE